MKKIDEEVEQLKRKYQKIETEEDWNSWLERANKLRDSDFNQYFKLARWLIDIRNE